MKVFISWSGSKSRAVAVALSEWLPAVINSLEPFVSSRDIDAGTRWQLELAEQLESTNFGVVCVTQENQREPWRNFEAGALAKAVCTSRVVPLTIDLKPSDLELPLGQFQAQAATESGISEVLKAMNTASDAPLDQALLDRAVRKWWPDLETDLDKIEKEAVPSSPVRTHERPERELLEETLDTVRSLARSLNSVLPRRRAARVAPDLTAALSSQDLIAWLEESGARVTLLQQHATPDGRRGRMEIRLDRPIPSALLEAIEEAAARDGLEIAVMYPHPPKATQESPETPSPDDEEPKEPAE